MRKGQSDQPFLVLNLSVKTLLGGDGEDCCSDHDDCTDGGDDEDGGDDGGRGDEDRGDDVSRRCGSRST